MFLLKCFTHSKVILCFSPHPALFCPDLVHIRCCLSPCITAGLCQKSGSHLTYPSALPLFAWPSSTLAVFNFETFLLHCFPYSPINVSLCYFRRNLFLLPPFHFLKGAATQVIDVNNRSDGHVLLSQNPLMTSYWSYDKVKIISQTTHWNHCDSAILSFLNILYTLPFSCPS